MDPRFNLYKDKHLLEANIKNIVIAIKIFRLFKKFRINGVLRKPLRTAAAVIEIPTIVRSETSSITKTKNVYKVYLKNVNTFHK